MKIQHHYKDKLISNNLFINAQSFSDIENEQLSKFTEQLKIKFLTIAEKIDN